MKNLDLQYKLLSYAGKNSNDPADVTKVNQRVFDEGIENFSRLCVSIPDGDTLTPTLSGTPVSFLAVITDQELTATLNGGSETLTLTPRAATIRTPTLSLFGSFTGLTLQNNSGIVANVEILSATK